MATLKIIAGQEQWITDVRRIIMAGCFNVPQHDPNETYKQRSDRMLKAAADAGLTGSGPCIIHTVDFENAERGVALDVYLTGEENPQFWLVPRRSCFLMGDDGRTIDRI